MALTMGKSDSLPNSPRWLRCSRPDELHSLREAHHGQIFATDLLDCPVKGAKVRENGLLVGRAVEVTGVETEQEHWLPTNEERVTGLPS